MGARPLTLAALRDRLDGERAKRDAEIVRLRDLGFTYAEIAHRCGMTRARGQQIYTREKALQAKEASLLPPQGR